MNRLLTLLGTMPGLSCGSFHSISHMAPSSGGSRLRSSARTSSRLAPHATGGPPCTWGDGTRAGGSETFRRQGGLGAAAASPLQQEGRW